MKGFALAAMFSIAGRGILFKLIQNHLFGKQGIEYR